MGAISFDEFMKLKNTNLIDIRNNSFYLKEHIPGAISIEEKDLFFHYDNYLKKGEKYYLYCFSGVRSKLLSSYLDRKGYQTFSINGGYQGYLLKR